MRKTIRTSDIRKRHPEEKKAYDRSKLWLNYVIRPLSFPITKVFIYLKITPNQTTIASILFGIIGSFLIATGSYSLAIIGALFVNLFTLLDAIDGTIARTLKMQSLQGQFLDDVAGFVVITFLYPCIGLGLFFDKTNCLQSIIHLPICEGCNVFYIIIGSLGGSLRIMHLNMTIQYNALIEQKNMQLGLFHKKDQIDQEEIHKTLIPAYVRMIRFIRSKIIPNLISPNGFIYPLLLLSTIFSALHIFLLFYSFFHIIYFFIYYYRNAINLS